MDGPRVAERPPVHQQVRRVELRRVAMGDGNPGRSSLPRGPSRETRTSAGGGLQDEQATKLQSEHVRKDLPTCLVVKKDCNRCFLP